MHTWVLPAEPVPVRLMNTIWADTYGIHDDLTTTDDVRDWLLATEVSDRVKTGTRQELERARLLRDALRRLAAFVSDDPRQAAQSPLIELDEAIATVNALAADAPRDLLALRQGRLTLAEATAASPMTAALGKVATDAVHLFTGPDALRLRACQAPGCVLYFVKSHARREWCSEACGNRVRAARHYQRIRVKSMTRKPNRPIR